jgi:hypothetical protein
MEDGWNDSSQKCCFCAGAPSKMAKRPKLKRKAKRDLQKESLHISSDPAQALARLLKSNKRLIRAAKQEFDAAHAKGMNSLASGDTAAFGEAIKDETAAIGAFSKVRLPQPK